MNNTIVAAILYLCGILIYFIGTFLRKDKNKPLIEYAHEINEHPELVSDRAICITAIIILALHSFIWPVLTVLEIKGRLKGDNA